jgi:hypothetical protein
MLGRNMLGLAPVWSGYIMLIRSGRKPPPADGMRCGGRPCAPDMKRWAPPARRLAGLWCVCCPSYVVITVDGSWYDRSTRFFTPHLGVVHL